ncbi:MAG TPA: CoA ester lyase [Acidimicrobiia bacterium]|jgi:citrate lyase subunit beta/citryl-CoA lyase
MNPPQLTGRLRSLLFVPGDRPDLAAKAHRSEPDAVVLDLEDAVAADRKADAREVVAEAVAHVAATSPATVWVRVNPPASEWFTDDVAVLPIAGLTGLVVPKLDTRDDVDAVARATDLPVFAGLETVRGVADAREVLVGPVAACYFGAEDYIADLGGVRTEDNAEVAVARALVGIAARLAGVPALDQVVLDFHDTDRFVTEARAARALGYTGKICIHPSQVPLANEQFVPSAEEIDRATRLLAVFEEALAEGRAACAFEGTMVDEVVARQARAVLERGS